MNGDLDYVIMQVVCDGLFLHKLPSDFGFFQENASILKESVKTSTAIMYVLQLHYLELHIKTNHAIHNFN